MISQELLTPGTIIRSAKSTSPKNDRRIVKWEDNWCTYRTRGIGEPFSAPEKTCWVTTIEDWAGQIVSA
jgi:hypothetical protein